MPTPITTTPLPSATGGSASGRALTTASLVATGTSIPAPPPGLAVPTGWRYLAAPSVEPVSFADVQSQLRIDSADEQALLTTYIVAARMFAEADMQRTLITRQIQVVTEPEPEHWHGGLRCRWGRGYVDLPRGPVSSLDVVTDRNGASVPAATYRLGRVGVMDVLVDHGLPRPAFITYTAGFGPSPTDVPADIRTGIMLHVGQLWDNRSASTTKPQSHIALGLDAIYGQYRTGGIIG